MSKLSSHTTTADDNNNNAQGTTAATADEVVHVELDSHAIALAEMTDVHPHLATSDPEQVDRHLSACTQAAASEYYTPPKLPDCVRIEEVRNGAVNARPTKNHSNRINHAAIKMA